MSSTPISQASTMVENDSLVEHKGRRRRALKRARDLTTSQDILLFLIAFRILNALSVRTFFQPDEFFQSLEPAWQMAFGAHSGAWITWEWNYRLRSAIHPAMFTFVYWVTSRISDALNLQPAYRAELLLAAPKITQAILAGLGDYYTWKLAERVYGRGSSESWAALALTAGNPWQWFCSTRTLSNCLETTLTTVALYLWPWQWSSDTTSEEEVDEDGLRIDGDSQNEADELSKLRRCLLLAALACVLRPTNLLIWLCLASFSLLKSTSYGRLVPFRWAGSLIWIHVSSVAMLRATKKERYVLLKEATLCGSLILALSALVDRLYYQQWTFSAFRFLYFNVVQSLAVIYGKNDWHYYMSQGVPLLLTTYLPFAIVGLFTALSSSPSRASDHQSPHLRGTICYQLASVAISVPFVLSFISHKEVRFIYPLLPMLHVLAADPFSAFFYPAVSSTFSGSFRKTSWKRVLLFLMIAANVLIALFATQWHQPAPLSVLTWLREQHEEHYLAQPPQSKTSSPDTTMTVGFLMPCHSTPWRSHLIHSGIKAWALGCEPPVDLNASARAIYVDEADQFYNNPASFLRRTMGPPPRRKGFLGARAPQPGLRSPGLDPEKGWDGKQGKKLWPEYLAFFEQLEPAMKIVLRESGYRECWRGWNSWFHDDWRRKGDIVVWCLRERDRDKRS